MVITEREAKTKWCPFVRGEVQVEVIDRTPEGDRERRTVALAAINRDRDGNVSGANCIGSRCMAWQSAGRKRSWIVQSEGKEEEWAFDPRKERRGYANVVVLREIDEDQGVCGLAGKP